MAAISLHRLWLISKTTKRPTTSEFLQLFRTSAKFFQSAFFAILYQAFRDALHSPCLAAASRIAFRLTIRITNLRNMRSYCQSKTPILASQFGVNRGGCPRLNSERSSWVFRGSRKRVLDAKSGNLLSWIQILREETFRAALGCGGDDEGIPETDPRFVFNAECHRKF